MIAERNHRIFITAFCRNLNLRTAIAVVHRIAEKIVKDPLYFIGIAIYHDIVSGTQAAFQIFFFQHRTKFIDELFQKTGEIDLAVL